MKHEPHMCYGGDCGHESHYAEGGSVKSNTRSWNNEKGINHDINAGQGGIGISPAGVNARSLGGGSPAAAKKEHERVLGEMRSMKKPELYADGGDVADDDEMHPMVSKVMMSRGGMIANEDEPEADSMPAEFDDLALDDHLEGTNSGAADGDEIGDSQEDDDRHDIVSKILSSRKKKDRMPRPA